jgi:paraquat-inducible protein B|tara:strand:+ start:748 stop:1575 length:828 start_codon:yes stop_codon:yes gene_type:complete
MPEPITFGTIMAGVGALTSLAGGGLSFGQAAKQKKAQEKAERESMRLMQEARRRLQTRFYEQLQVPTEAYERQFRENTAQQKQSLQALQESDPRTLAAGVGKVQAVGVAQNEKVREQMANDLMRLQEIKAQEMSAINDELVSLDAGEAASQDIRSREANMMSAAAIGQGVSGVSKGLTTGAEVVPLFFKNAIDRKLGKITGKDLKPGNRFYDAQQKYRREQTDMNLRDSFENLKGMEDIVNPYERQSEAVDFLTQPLDTPPFVPYTPLTVVPRNK